MIKILNLVGARPQFVKAAAISLEIKKHKALEEVLVHSGQHYDKNLSDVFFQQLNLPKPNHQLVLPNLKGQSAQTGEMLVELEKVLMAEKPDCLLVYGDTNTTLAGALAASKLHIPIAHVEAGLRSYNWGMPEEINRVITDRLSTFLFVPNGLAIENLRKEGILNSEVDKPSPLNTKVEEVGDVMIDALRIYSDKAVLNSAVSKRIKGKRPLIVLTLHRNFNADNPERLTEVINAFNEISEDFEVVWPVHPRTAKQLKTDEVNFTLLPPVDYLSMLALQKMAHIVVTDSGGIQKEAHFFKKPLLILRPETEWAELVEYGVARLCEINKDAIVDGVKSFKGFSYPATPALYGNGFAANRIVSTLIQSL